MFLWNPKGAQLRLVPKNLLGWGAVNTQHQAVHRKSTKVPEDVPGVKMPEVIRKQVEIEKYQKEGLLRSAPCLTNLVMTMIHSQRKIQKAQGK